MYTNSPVQLINFRQHDFFIKRDDMLSPEFSGNKSRKLYHFLCTNYPQIDTVISYGGNQSNLMYSLSCLAKIKQWKFIYYTKALPQQLKINPQGNLREALNNGMNIIELANFNEDSIINMAIGENELLIRQGALQKESEVGLEQLAMEIIEYTRIEFLDKYSVFIPSGTGVSALYLQKYLPNNTVYTTNCIGSVDYLKQQFYSLENDDNIHPQILPRNKKYIFGKPDLDLLAIYEELKNTTNIEFDLLYDPIGWITLLDHIQIIQQPLIYVHCGGILGNQSMLSRYNFAMKN